MPSMHTPGRKTMCSMRLSRAREDGMGRFPNSSLDQTNSYARQSPPRQSPPDRLRRTRSGVRGRISAQQSNLVRVNHPLHLIGNSRRAPGQSILKLSVTQAFSRLGTTTTKKHLWLTVAKTIHHRLGKFHTPWTHVTPALPQNTIAHPTPKLR